MEKLYFKSFIGIAFFLGCLLNINNAQTPENHFLTPRVDSLVYPNSIALNIGVNYIDETNYFGGLFAATNTMLLQAIPAVKGYFPLSEKVSLTGRIPFLINTGLVKDPSLPDLYNVEVNAGFGDISAGMWWQENYSGINPLKLGVHIGVIAPTGSSRFDEGDNGFIDFGNGFWALPLEVAVVQNLTRDLYMYGNLGFIPRFTRTFTRGSTARQLSPEPIYGFKGGAAYIVRKGFFKNVAIGIEYQHFSIGNINRVRAESTNIEEGGGDIHRVGLILTSLEHSAFSSASFIGVERFNRSTFFVVGVNWTGGFNIFGFNFDQKRIFVGNKF